MLLTIGDKHDIVAKTVDDHIGQTAVEPEFDAGLTAGIHLK